MPVLEKLAFLGAVTLASVLIAQELDKTIAALDRPSEVIDLEEIPRPSPAPDIPPTLMSLAPSPTGFLDTLTACKGMAPSIGANVDQDLVVTDYKRFVLAEGHIRLATAPVGGGCLCLRATRISKGSQTRGKAIWSQPANILVLWGIRPAT